MRFLTWLPGVVPIVGALLNAMALEAGWQALSQHPVWLAVPWTWIGLLAVFYLLGVLIAQLQDSRSPIRTWLENRGRIFEIKVFATPGIDAPERIQLVAILTFRKDCDPVKLAVWGKRLVASGTDRSLLLKGSLPAMRRGEKHRVDLGALVIPSPGWKPLHSVFGHPTGTEKLPPLAVPIVPNDEWSIDLDVGGQTERCLLWVRDFKQTNGLGMVVATPEDLAKANA